jgi:hypothetical protein
MNSFHFLGFVHEAAEVFRPSGGVRLAVNWWEGPGAKGLSVLDSLLKIHPPDLGPPTGTPKAAALVSLTPSVIWIALGMA